MAEIRFIAVERTDLLGNSQGEYLDEAGRWGSIATAASFASEDDACYVALPRGTFGGTITLIGTGAARRRRGPEICLTGSGARRRATAAS